MPAKRIDQYDGAGCYQAAQRAARYGHREWIWWRDVEGEHAARKTPANLKAAMLASGTKGRWTLIGSDGVSMRGFWWLGINMLRQMKRGWI